MSTRAKPMSTRAKIMRLLGAKVILTPAAERGSGMVRKAKELAEKHPAFLTMALGAGSVPVIANSGVSAEGPPGSPQGRDT